MRQGSSWLAGAAVLAVVALVLPGCTVPQNTARMEALDDQGRLPGPAGRHP